MPSHFARQFGYDQLYVGNPNTGLRFSDNLFEGARAWYYSVAEETGAIFGHVTGRLITTQASASVHGTSSRVGYPLWNEYFLYQEYYGIV